MLGLIRNKGFLLPIVHAESDYKIPLFVGDVLEIQVSIAKLGNTSFTLSYNLLNAKEVLVGTAQTVHVAIDKKTQKKIPLPKDLRSKFEDWV